MPRARNIKPGFFHNEDIVELPYEYRLLFIGIWTVSDREGRVEYRPKKIKMQLFPADDISIEDGIDSLVDLGFVEIYESNNIKYLQVNNWLKHQSPHVKEAESTIPAPGKNSASRPDSLNLIPDSFNKDHFDDPAFDLFWSHYPKKTNKQKAESAWRKLRPNEDTLKTILENIDQRLLFSDWSVDEKEFIPHASTYLNQRRWEDEIIPKSNGTKPTGGNHGRAGVTAATIGPDATNF